MKNVLIFLGSPRTGGNTELLAQAFLSGVSSEKYSCETIRLASLNLSPCNACDCCWSNGEPCVIDDDMNAVFHKIENADVLVFASPVYYYSWSAQMKILFDRFYPSSQKPETLRDKRTVLLAACADATERSFDGVLTAYRLCAEYLNWRSVGEVLAFQCWNPGDVSTSGDWLVRAKKMGESL